mgnify:CR=1 FL=1
MLSSIRSSPSSDSHTFGSFQTLHSSAASAKSREMPAPSVYA